MAQPQPVAPVESLSGLVERVTFFNEDNGFAVLKVKARGQREEITVVGSLASVSPGEWLTAEGRWIHDRQFGRQFKADLLKSTPPTTREGIQKYLGSGMVKGIGPVYARKLVEKFGETIFDIIETSSARLEEVEGIGPQRRRQIKEAWAEQKVIREIMVFLHSQGVSTSRAVRIYKTYGDQAIEEVRANPYTLARDIPGIGFRTADQIARNMGVPHDSILRACAGLEHVLLEGTGQGHCALPESFLKQQTAELLGVSETIVETAIDRTLREGNLARDQIANETFIFLPPLKRAEEEIASRILKLVRNPATYPPVQFEKAIAWCEQRTGKVLAPSQREALRQALTSRLLVITGGPGVGKTTLVNSILMILRAKQVKCFLCAPTGRAAKRLSESTGLTAKTIHRLLEVEPGRRGFICNDTNPLRCDLLVVDEMSMVDVPLMAHLLRALPAHASLLLVGDADQLPSVGPGAVLQNLIESSVVPVCRLTEIFRQASSSRIISNAHRINQGLMPELAPRDTDSDFYFVSRPEPDRIADTLIEMVKTRIPARTGTDPVRDIQVLTPMNRGSLGVHELNTRLQQALNPRPAEDPFVERFGWRFCVGDKVMQTENDYEKDVFNGDIGRVSKIDPLERQLIVLFEERQVAYDFGELDELVLAYAITIHKSQGSEFPVVVMPVATQHYLLLQRNLIYTGITRGKRMVVVIGQEKALRLAVSNNRTERRFSGLLVRLKACGPEPTA